MAQEIELKLSLDDQDKDLLIKHPLFADATEFERWFLHNRYFDTPDQQLTQAGISLRIRSQGDQLIQTLKGRGSHLSGLHQRLEIEWPLEKAELDFSVIPAGLIPESVNLDDIVPLFQTDFDRTQWQIKTPDADLWVMVDQGVVRCGEQETPISEVELELHQGNPTALFDVALTLTKDFPLVPNDVSKAERGYRLLNQTPSAWAKPPVIDAHATLESAFEQVMAFELESLHRLWEAFHFSQNWNYLHQFRNTLGNIRTNFLLFSKMLHPDGVAVANEAVDWLDHNISPMLNWWPACFVLSQQASEQPRSASDQLHHLKALQALEQLAQLQRRPEFGHNLLVLGRWLYTRDWAKHHTEKTSTRANAEIGTALLGPVKQQWLALQLEECGGNVSSWLERQSVIRGLNHICTTLEHAMGADMSLMREELQALENSLVELSAMDVVSKLGDWIENLSQEEQQSINSWARSQTVIMRNMNELSQRMLFGMSTALPA